MTLSGTGVMPDPARWNDAAALDYQRSLGRASATIEARLPALRRDAAQATAQWRGAARSDFDERTAHLVAALHDLDEHLAWSLAWLAQRQRAAAARAVPAPVFVPPAALLGASPQVPDRTRPSGG